MRTGLAQPLQFPGVLTDSLRCIECTGTQLSNYLPGRLQVGSRRVMPECARRVIAFTGVEDRFASGHIAPGQLQTTLVIDEQTAGFKKGGRRNENVGFLHRL